MKKFKVPVTIEATMVVNMTTDITIEAESQEQAEKLLNQMKEGGKANMSAIKEVDRCSFTVAEESAYQDLQEAIRGHRQGGIGGKVHLIEAEGDLEEVGE